MTDPPRGQALVKGSKEMVKAVLGAAGKTTQTYPFLHQVRETPSWPTPAFCTSIPTGMRGPTCIFWPT